MGPPLSPGLSPRSPGSDGIRLSATLQVPKNGPDAGLRAQDRRRSVHYWTDIAIFSRFYRHAIWVPTTPCGNLKWEYFNWPRRRTSRWGHFYYESSRGAG